MQASSGRRFEEGSLVSNQEFTKMGFRLERDSVTTDQDGIKYGLSLVKVMPTRSQILEGKFTVAVVKSENLLEKRLVFHNDFGFGDDFATVGGSRLFARDLDFYTTDVLYRDCYLHSSATGDLKVSQELMYTDPDDDMSFFRSVLSIQNRLVGQENEEDKKDLRERRLKKLANAIQTLHDWTRGSSNMNAVDRDYVVSLSKPDMETFEYQPSDTYIGKEIDEIRALKNVHKAFICNGRIRLHTNALSVKINDIERSLGSFVLRINPADGDITVLQYRGAMKLGCQEVRFLAPGLAVKASKNTDVVGQHFPVETYVDLGPHYGRYMEKISNWEWSKAIKMFLGSITMYRPADPGAESLLSAPHLWH